jgi:hypothetical protein
MEPLLPIWGKVEVKGDFNELNTEWDYEGND